MIKLDKILYINVDQRFKIVSLMKGKLLVIFIHISLLFTPHNCHNEGQEDDDVADDKNNTVDQ